MLEALGILIFMENTLCPELGLPWLIRGEPPEDLGEFDECDDVEEEKEVEEDTLCWSGLSGGEGVEPIHKQFGFTVLFQEAGNAPVVAAATMAGYVPPPLPPPTPYPALSYTAIG